MSHIANHLDEILQGFDHQIEGNNNNRLQGKFAVKREKKIDGKMHSAGLKVDCSHVVWLTKSSTRS